MHVALVLGIEQIDYGITSGSTPDSSNIFVFFSYTIIEMGNNVIFVMNITYGCTYN
jgi:hypothetical protein